MAYANPPRRVEAGALLRAPFAALQWRLLLLWMLLLALPTAIVALPLTSILGDALDRSVHAAAFARRLDGLMLGDLMGAFADHGDALRGAGLLALVVSVLFGPWLAGMAVASGRAGRVLGFGGLLRGGLVEYGRMFRVLLWALVPYAIVFGIAGMAMHMVDARADKATLQSQADAARQVANWVFAILFVLAHAIVESARAAFIVDPLLRSATRALGRALAQLLRRPLSTLLSYLLIGAVGSLLAGALALARVHTLAVGAGGLVLAFVLTEGILAAIGWMRTARLFALAEVGRSLRGARRGNGLPPAL